jgi:hypothetical protein
MPFALFLDILGSTRLLSSLPDSFEFPTQEHRWKADAALRNYWHYQDARRSFHESLGFCHYESFQFEASFSDCAYLVFGSAFGVCRAAASMMYHCYSYGIPVRAGVGFGNFHFDQGVVRSDGGNKYSTEASFYGSSIVRAHHAEHCGLKGFRVFVHRSAEDALEALHPHVRGFFEVDWDTFEEGQSRGNHCATLLELPTTEASPDIRFELGFLGDNSVDEFYRHVAAIESRFPPTSDAQVHYHATREALLRIGNNAPPSMTNTRKLAIRPGVTNCGKRGAGAARIPFGRAHAGSGFVSAPRRCSLASRCSLRDGRVRRLKREHRAEYERNPTAFRQTVKEGARPRIPLEAHPGLTAIPGSH